MKRFTGHPEPWGEFVDVKINAPQVLTRQLTRMSKGSVLLGTVTDPYQPLEKRYGITRGCLMALSAHQFPVHLLTRSPLVIRDIDLFKEFQDIEVGLSITTDDERIKKIFEPASPSIASRLEALKKIHDAGIETYVFIGPMLGLDPQRLIDAISDSADSVLIDRLNYSHKTVSIYRRFGLKRFLEDEYFRSTAMALKTGFEKRGIPTSVLFE